MVKLFGIVHETDTFTELLFQKGFHHPCITGQDSMVQAREIYGFCFLAEPLLYCIFVNIHDFFIWYFHTYINGTVFKMSLHSFQITSKKQEIPEVIPWPANIPISNIFVNLFFYGAACKQGFYFLPGITVCFPDQFTDNII